MNKNNWIACLLLLSAWFAAPVRVASQEAQTFTLKEAVDGALRNSPEVTLAERRHEVAARNIAVMRAAFQPNLYTGSGAAYTYGFPQTPSGVAPSIVNLSYVQTVFNPSLRGLRRASDERVEA